MQAALRPMNLGEILDKTFAVYRKGFWPFVGVAALLTTAIYGMALPFEWPFKYSLARYWNFYTSLGYYDVCILIVLAAFPAFVQVTSASLIGGRVSAHAALRSVCASWRGYLSVAILELLGGLVIPEVLYLASLVEVNFALHKIGPVTARTTPPTALLVAIPVAVTVVLVMWILTCLAFSEPIAAIERVYGLRALRRSWSLTKKRRWRILLYCLTVAVVGWILVATLELLTGLLFSSLYGSQHFGVTDTQIYAASCFLLQFLMTVVVLPILPIAVTLFYFDQRVRLEGYDVERMMEAAGLLAPAAAAGGETAGVPTPGGVDA
jgi:hypothetical protein